MTSIAAYTRLIMVDRNVTANLFSLIYTHK